MSEIAVIKGRFIGGGLFALKEGKEKFSACIVLEGDDDAKKIRAIRDEALAEEFGDKLPKDLQDWTLNKGEDEDFASFGKMFINPKSTNPVAVGYKRDGSFVTTAQDDGIVYAGCHVHASVSAFAYPGDAKKSIRPGVTLLLRAVCFWKDGEALGNRFSESEFAGVESEMDEAAFGAGDSETVSSLLG